MRVYLPAYYTQLSTEIHGDRAFGDDPAMVTGFALLDGKPVAIIWPAKRAMTQKKAYAQIEACPSRKATAALQVMKFAKKSKNTSFPLSTRGAEMGCSHWAAARSSRSR